MLSQQNSRMRIRTYKRDKSPTSEPSNLFVRLLQDAKQSWKNGTIEEKQYFQ